jgi:PAS domain S-box-containing protein
VLSYSKRQALNVTHRTASTTSQNHHHRESGLGVIASPQPATNDDWLEKLPFPALIIHADTHRILKCNQAALKQYRYEREELLRLQLSDLRRHNGMFKRPGSAPPKLLGDRDHATHCRKDGTTFEAEVSRDDIQYEGISAELLLFQDVTRRLEMEATLRTNEQRYRWLVANTTDCVWRCELEMAIPTGLSTEEQIERIYRHGYVAEVNATMAAAYGYANPAAMIGIRIDDIMPRKEKRNIEYLQDFVHNGYQLSDAESHELDAQGRPRWFVNRIMGEVEAGRFVRAWGTSRDITERKIAELRQQQSEQFWHDALEKIQLIGVGLDGEGKVTFVNPYFLSLTGWTREEVLGKDWFADFVPTEASAQRYLKQLKTETLSHYVVDQLLTKAGEIRTIRWNNTVIRDLEGMPRGVFSIGEDVTMQRNMVAALRESEARYRRLMDGLPLGIYRSTPDGRLTFCNPTCARFFGLTSPAEAQNLNLETYPFGNNYSREEFRTRMEAEGEIRGQESQWSQPEGTTLWLRESARAVRDAEGRIQYYEGTLEDITAEKLALSAKLESEEQHRLLMQLAPISIFMARQGILCHANDNFAKTLGFHAPADLVGKSFLELLHPSERDEIKQKYLDTPGEYGLLSVEERRFLRKDGSTILTQAHVANVRVGSERGSIVVVRDITSERQAEQQSRRWQFRIQEMQKLESLGVLAGGLAHDFNNQLSVIRGHIQLTQNLLLHHSAAQDLLKPIEIAARHASDLCQQMLNFAGRGQLEFSEVNISALVQETAALLRITCHKKAQIEIELSKDLPVVQAEPAQLRQVVLNLVHNAAEAVEEPSGKIIVRTYKSSLDQDYGKSDVTLELPDGDYVVLEVSDNGIGMDINTRRRVFEPFFTTKQSGRGLGLAAVLGIVRSHGGAIEVNSKLKQGTTFRVFLPLKKLANETVVHAAALQPLTRSGGETILVVDDDESLRTLAAKILTKRGWQVLEAEDGAMAVQAVKDQGKSIHLALIDLAMPNKDGVQTLREIWEICPGLPAIAMSGAGTMELERRFAGFPLLGVLCKPFTPSGLLQALEHALTATSKI